MCTAQQTWAMDGSGSFAAQVCLHVFWIFSSRVAKNSHATRVLHPTRETLDTGNSKSRLNSANTDRGEAQFTARKERLYTNNVCHGERLKVEECRNGNRALSVLVCYCPADVGKKSEKTKWCECVRTPACTRILHSNIAHIYAVNLVLNLIRDFFFQK